MPHPITYFSKFKPKKAKFGYNINLDSGNLIEVGLFLNELIGPRDRERWFVELSGNGYGPGLVNLRLYLNDDSTADKIEKMIAQAI